MTINFINPFQFGTFREWDCIIYDDTKNVVYRTSTQFRIDDDDKIIKNTGVEIFNSQGYDSSLTLDSITIDKPDSWQYINQ